MRILAGEARGRPLRTPAGRATRPTSARMREALFARCQGQLPGARVLDLFAGTGSLGLEALSRGAAHATFVEVAEPASRLLNDNVRQLGFAAQSRVLRLPVARALHRLAGDRFDLVVLDPPYGQGEIGPALQQLSLLGLLAPGATVMAVHGAREEAPPPPTGLFLVDTRRFGDSAVTRYGEGSGSGDGPEGP